MLHHSKKKKILKQEKHKKLKKRKIPQNHREQKSLSEPKQSADYLLYFLYKSRSDTIYAP